MKKLIEHKISLPLKVMITLALLSIITMVGYYKFNGIQQQQRIVAAIAELDGYQKILQEYYQQQLSLPPVGKVFENAINPQGRSGCDIDGSCPTYYERLLGESKMAFMAKTVADIDKPDRIFMAFVERDGKIITYCGPWTYKNDASIPIERLPKTCNSEIKKVLGL